MNLLPFVAAGAVLLGGCQQSATVRDTSSGFRQLQGSSLILKATLFVPPEKARVFVQDGRATNDGNPGASGGFNSYKTHCGFEISSIDHDGFTIEPQTFTVTRVQGTIEPVVMSRPFPPGRLQLASGMDGGGSSAYYEGYHFWLSSESQPEVRRMSCYGIYAEPYRLYPPTLQEIREALGDVAEFRQ